mgnify:CR=1 FL=1
MKNYIRDVIDRYIKHDYPEEVDQDFRTWLISEENPENKKTWGGKPKLPQLPVIVILWNGCTNLRGSGRDSGFIFYMLV